MQRSNALLFSIFALLLDACGEPRCPSGYLLRGDTCYRCRLVEGSKDGACVVGDAAVAGGQEGATSEAGNDPEASAEQREPRDESSLDRDNPPPENEALDGGSTALDAASPGSPEGADRAISSACASEPCQHGGVCSDAEGVVSCDCTGKGYEGPRCETDLDECTGSNVCSGTSENGVAFSFPCVNEAPHYRCQGQFPDWPVQDPPNRFSRGFQVVDDAKTGLQWEHPAAAQDFPWQGAVDHCANKGSNWRLPTKAELESLVDDTRSGPSIDPVFTDAPAATYWCSTLFAGLPPGSNPGAQFAWTVSFADGTVFPVQLFNGARTRCVRLRQ